VYAHSKTARDHPKIQSNYVLQTQKNQGTAVGRLAAGAHFSLAVTDGGVVSFGTNSFGQLGRETPDTFDCVPALVNLTCFNEGSMHVSAYIPQKSPRHSAKSPRHSAKEP